jgi:hypothetical protein
MSRWHGTTSLGENRDFKQEKSSLPAIKLGGATLDSAQPLRVQPVPKYHRVISIHIQQQKSVSHWNQNVDQRIQLIASFRKAAAVRICRRPSLFHSIIHLNDSGR